MAENNNNNDDDNADQDPLDELNALFTVDHVKFADEFADSLLEHFDGDTFLARQVALTIHNRRIATHLGRIHRHNIRTNQPQLPINELLRIGLDLGFQFGFNQIFCAFVIGQPRLLFDTADDIRHLFRLDYTPYVFRTTVNCAKHRLSTLRRSQRLDRGHSVTGVSWASAAPQQSNSNLFTTITIRRRNIQYCRIHYGFYIALKRNLAEQGPELLVVPEPGCGGYLGEWERRLEVLTPMRMKPPAEREEWAYGEPRKHT